MPLVGLLHPMIAVGFAVHAMKTGRPQFWTYILLLVPMVCCSNLLYTRVLEAQGRLAEAKQEYDSLCGYYAGFEARTRYALMLLRNGEPSRARALFQDVVKAGNARRIAVLESDRKWLKVAKANL